MENPNVTIASDFGPILININDLYIGRSISKTGYWGLGDIRIMKTIFDNITTSKGRMTYYDVGANIGTHTLALAKMYKDRITIRSFEAQRQIYYMLCGTVALNGLRNVTCHNNAVSNIGGRQMAIRLPDYSRQNNFGGVELTNASHNSEAHAMVGDGSENVATVALDDFDEEVEFIKIDIEGMEIYALEGARKTFERRRPVARVETLKSDRELIYAFFRSVDYVGQQLGHELIAYPKEAKIDLTEGMRAW